MSQSVASTRGGDEFLQGEGVGGSIRLQTPVIGSHSALAMSVHHTYFDLATPVANVCNDGRVSL